MAVDKFAKYCVWFLSHCAKGPGMCKHWSTDYVRDCCKGTPNDMAKPKCTGFEKTPNTDFNLTQPAASQVKQMFDGLPKEKDMFIQRLQNSPLTSWIWQFWQHKETGYLVMLPFWKKPGKRYYKVKMKE